MSNPVQVNMYGIRYFIDGDLSDPHVKKLMVQVRNELQQLKGRNINNINHVWLDKPNAYRVDSKFGIDSAYIDVPGFMAAMEKGEKEDQKDEVEVSYRFVPAICIAEHGDVKSYITRPYMNQLDESDISVCAGADWIGSVGTVKESLLADDPGEVYKDGEKTDEREILACYNWGNRDFYHTWDGEDEYTEEDTDSLFSPAAYLGRNSDNGGIDYAWDAALAGGAVYYWPLGTPTPNCPGVLDDIEAVPDGGDWISTGLKYARNDDYVVSYAVADCKDDWWQDTYLVFRYRCGAGHLFFEYEVEGWQEHLKCTGIWYYMGFCFGYGNTYCFEATNTFPVARATGGGGQSRTTHYSYYNEYYGYTDDDLQRSEGEIEYDRAIWVYGVEQIQDKTAIMSGPCDTNQTQTYDDWEGYPEYYGFCGAYIQDIGEPDFICPTASFHNKYMLAIVEWYQVEHQEYACSPWAAGGYGYDGGGVYDHGYVSGCTNGWTVYEWEGYYTLCINLNGERHVIDKGDDDDDYFEVTDSLILDFMGTPVYMYSYVRFRYVGGTPAYRATYTRYGYFLNDVHHQSEKFNPAGVFGDYDQLLCLHDVAGSAAARSMYGWGQCAGYIIKDITTKKGAVSRETRT